MQLNASSKKILILILFIAYVCTCTLFLFTNLSKKYLLITLCVPLTSLSAEDTVTYKVGNGPAFIGVFSRDKTKPQWTNKPENNLENPRMWYVLYQKLPSCHVLETGVAFSWQVRGICRYPPPGEMFQDLSLRLQVIGRFLTESWGWWEWRDWWCILRPTALVDQVGHGEKRAVKDNSWDVFCDNGCLALT